MRLKARLETERLILRRWTDADIEPLSRINADPQVMWYFPETLSIDQTEEMVKRMEAHFEAEGCGLWAVEISESKQFIGFVGLNKPLFKAPFTPCVEVGWRLARKFWGKGYAPEAARAAIRDGFERLNLDEILSWTTVANKNSRRVMEKIGMTRSPEEDFLHPMIPAGHPLRAHILYRLTRANWLASQNK